MAFNLGQGLLGGLTGFAMGGPWGAGAGFLAGALGGSRDVGGARDPSLGIPAGGPQDVQNYLARQAYHRGLMSVYGNQGLAQAGGGVGGAVGSPGAQTRRDQQRGGSMYPSTLPQADNRQLLSEYLGAGLAGVGGPQAEFAGQFARGRNIISEGAQQSRSGLMEALAGRGMLRSGVLSRGLGEIERGRVGALGDLAGRLGEQRLQAAVAAQQQAASLMAGGLGQQQGLAAAEPSLGDYLADLAGAYAQSRNQPEPFDFGPYLTPQQPPQVGTVVQPPGARRMPPGWGEYIQGRA